MSKLSRTALKEIVKEVMVEILMEGLDTGSHTSQENESLFESTTHRKHNVKKAVKNKPEMNMRSSYLDNIKFGANKASIDESRSNMLPTMPKTNNAIMEDIFKDTATTTLQEQLSAERNKQPVAKDAASVAARESDLSSLFGNSASKWAQLAFADPVTK